MLILYHMVGFRSDGTQPGDDTIVLILSLEAVPNTPSWITVS